MVVVSEIRASCWQFSLFGLCQYIADFITLYNICADSRNGRAVATASVI